MGLDLSGLGTLLRRGIDDVGSAFTGQDWHSAPTPAPQPTVQAPQAAPSAGLQVRPFQGPSLNTGPQVGAYNPTPIPVVTAPRRTLNFGNQQFNQSPTMQTAAQQAVPVAPPPPSFKLPTAPDVPATPITPSFAAPAKGDPIAIHAALNNFGNLSQDDQARTINRASMSGALPHNYAAALQNQVLRPNGVQQPLNPLENFVKGTIDNVHGAANSVINSAAGTYVRGEANILPMLAGLASGNKQATTNASNAYANDFNAIPGILKQGLTVPDQTITQNGQTYRNPAFQAFIQNAAMAGETGPKDIGIRAAATDAGKDIKIIRPSPLPADAPPELHAAYDRIANGTAADTAASSIKLSPGEAAPATEPKQLRIASSDNGTLPRSQQSGIALSRPSELTPAAYADTFGVPKEQAAADLAAKPVETGPTPKVTALEADATKQAGMATRLNPEEKKAALLQDNQQTKHNINLDPGEGNTKGAIIRAEAVTDESKDLFKKADIMGGKIDKHDQALLSERADPNVEIKPHNPERFQQAAEAYNDAYDHHLAAQRAGGADTLRYGSGNYTPLNFKATPKQMDELGIPDANRINNKGYTGFRDVTRQYRSYADGAKVGLKRLNDDPLQDHRDYSAMSSTNLRNGLLRSALEKSNPGEVANKGHGAEANGTEFKQAADANLPFNASKNVNSYLGNYKQAYTPTSAIGKAIDKGVRVVGGITKKGLFLGSVFHQAHITENVAFGTNPKIAALGLANEFKAKGGITVESYHKMLDASRQDGSLEYTRNMGIKLNDHSALDRYVSSFAIGMGRFAKEAGIPEGSPAAIDLGKINNHLLGRENAAAENINPTIEKFTSYFALAPHYLRTQLALVKEAILPKKLGGAGYDTLMNSKTAGGAARSAVVGPRLFGALAAITASSIIMNKFPTWQDAVREAGLQANNTNPNIQTNNKDSRGRGQLLNLPTDPLGLAFGLLTDPKHFFQSREAPFLSLATKAATNTGFNGQTLADPNKPNSIPIRIAKAAEQSVLPIGVQNFTNIGHNPNNPSVVQGLEQSVGFRVKTDPNDPQVVSQKVYIDQQKQNKNNIQAGNFSAINPALSNIDPKYTAAETAKYKAYLDLNPGKDPSGVANSREWSSLSASTKAGFLTMNDQKTGNQTLNPIFYINQKNAQSDPSRPHDALYDLTGNGVGFALDKDGNVTGSSEIPKAQIALDYAAQPATSDQKALIAAANPWLADYGKTVGDNAQNYQANQTAFLQKQGYSQKAIDNYFVDHPQGSAPPIAPPKFSPETQKLMDDYGNITDPTAKAQFFQDNAAELTRAYAADSLYKNQKAVTAGSLPLQDHPNPTPEQAAALAQLQKNPNHDKAIGKANASLIQAHPELAQYLADSGLYNTAKNLAKYQFRDPSQPNLNANQLINLGRPVDQATLKGVQNLGKYDIGKDANGKFSFLGAGGTGKFADGSAAGSGGSGGYQKHVKVAKVKVRNIRLHAPKVHKVRTSKSFKLKTPNSHLSASKGSAIKIKKVAV